MRGVSLCRPVGSGPILHGLALSLIALIWAAPPLRAGEALHAVEVTSDLAYVSGDEVPDRQRLDLYVPVGEGPWPVLLWIHGGAWAVGHRQDEGALARRFAERGIAVAAADHRMSKALWMSEKLSEGVEHPTHVQDVAAALAWLFKNAATHRLDPKRIFVGGFSSGAHLAALLATDPKYLKVHGLDSDVVKGALPVGGAYDIEAYYEAHLEANGKTMADQHVLDVFGHGDGALRDASPTAHMQKTKVPMLVLSEADTYGYTKVFEDRVKEAGIERIRFRHFPKRRHRTIGALMAREEADAARDLMIAFLRDPGAALPARDPAEALEARQPASGE